MKESNIDNGIDHLPYPSILREEVKNWFNRDVDSPYMSFCLNFKEDMKDKVPENVLHFDGTARLQTVSEKDNKWYHGFISKWFSLVYQLY